ncbi:MAG: hypothetical protein LBD23_15095, partial [Oscillospiraceae bacterium]|nr:hypothetical protein [Oscillospiraceae bacterium]
MKLVSKSNKNKDSNGAAATGARNDAANGTNNNTAAKNNNTAAAKVNSTAAGKISNTAAAPRGNVTAAGGAKNAAQKPKKKRKSHILTIVIIVLVIALGFSAFFISLGFYVDSLDTIFPNVWAEGIKLSGMTIDEAIDMLIAEGYESNAEGISATVAFPDGDSFSVTGEEVGLSFDARDAALAAFAIGRNGT